MIPFRFLFDMFAFMLGLAAVWLLVFVASVAVGLGV
jgi:hypothetical protein